MQNLTWNDLACEPKTETNSQIQGLVDLEQSEIDDVSGGWGIPPRPPIPAWIWKYILSKRSSGGKSSGGRVYAM